MAVHPEKRLEDLADANKMFVMEEDFHFLATTERWAKTIARYEAYKLSRGVLGAIVECGTFRGVSILEFAQYRKIRDNNLSSKIIAFDMFSDDFPDTKYEEDQAQRELWLGTAGGNSISTEQLEKLFAHHGIENYELVEGDIVETVPEFAKKNLGLKISLLHIDCDFVESTYCAMQNFYDKVSKGGVILLDNYGGEGTGGHSYHGDTKGVDDFFKERGVKPEIKTFGFVDRPSYIIKE
jgi:hypothetical protein